MNSETMAKLHSLQYLVLEYLGNMHDVIKRFHNLSRLKHLGISAVAINITNTTFYPLAGLPIQELIYTRKLSYVVKDFFVDKTSLAPLTSLQNLYTDFSMLPVIEFLRSPLELLLLRSFTHRPYFLSNTTFQALITVNQSLTTLSLLLPALHHIKNDTFMWTPNLVNLVILESAIGTLAKCSFCGLKFLQLLYLSNNKLTSVPSDALNVIGKFAPLQHLELRSNQISPKGDDAFGGLTSLTYLKLEKPSRKST